MNVNTKNSPRVRIAPSPSGYLHVGTARTAIFNWLFARRFNGRFLVRIEDTDAERSDSALVEPILSALRWLGIEADEPVVYQSERLQLYKGFAVALLQSGSGYRCFCSAEQLAQEREASLAAKQAPKYGRRCLGLATSEIEARLANNEPFAIRIKIPPGETRFHDMVSGEITRKNEDIEDLIVARSDGSATYNLAVVVDDHHMGISHVIRGNDHVSNTFKQIQLYRALGWEVPQFGHVPLILRPDKKKVSKRLGDKDVQAYQSEGILPQAMFNYLSLLGWSPKTDREIFTVEELISVFDPNGLNPSNAVFDEIKLEAMNKEHIQLMSNVALAELAAPLFVQAGVITERELMSKRAYLESIVGLLKERVRRIPDFVSLGKYFFSAEFMYEKEAAAKHFSADSGKLLQELASRFERVEPFSHDSLERALVGLSDERGIKKAALIHPTRLAVSGMSVGPGLYDLLATLGKKEVIERMKKTVDYISSGA